MILDISIHMPNRSQDGNYQDSGTFILPSVKFVKMDEANF